MIEATPSCFGGRFQGHSCQHSHQSSPGHPQVGQRKKRVKLLRVLGQVSGAHLHISKLGFIRNACSTLARILALLRASYWVNSSTSCSCPFHCACPCASRCANARRPWHRAATQRTGSRYHPQASVSWPCVRDAREPAQRDCAGCGREHRCSGA